MPKTWFVTGSSRGLGRALCEELLSHGENVVATARQTAPLASLSEKYGARVLSLALDVTDADAVRAAVANGIRTFGRLDVVVNNAGYGNIGPFEEMPEDDFRAQIETNLFGVVNVTRAVLPFLRKQRAGHIIQISSAGGRIALPGLSAYHAAKFAVEGFSEAVSKEVAPFGVLVTIVEPGGFRTDWAGSSMTVHGCGPEYAGTVGMIASHVQTNGDVQIGDPKKAAAAIMTIAAAANPPLRLLLGSDAVALVGTAQFAQSQSDEKWRDLSLSTDFGASAGKMAAPLVLS